MSNLVSPTVTASAGEMPPSFFNEAAKMSGAGLELSASSAEVYPPATLVAGLENGTLRPVIGKEFPLAEAAQAHRAVMEPGALGKIVLLPNK